jgi:hypothetical protein
MYELDGAYTPAQRAEILGLAVALTRGLADRAVGDHTVLADGRFVAQRGGNLVVMRYDLPLSCERLNDGASMPFWRVGTCGPAWWTMRGEERSVEAPDSSGH